MNSYRLDATTPDGRRVAVWRTSPSIHRPGHPVAVVGPGFGRTMADLASVALYLAANGVTVYRFDPLDHVGLSDGTIADYTLGATLESYRAVLRLVRGQEPWCPITVVGVSMSGRAALRAALAPCVRRLVTLVGVVDVISTLSAVFGPELVNRPYAQLPEVVDFESHQIRPHQIYLECHGGWGHLGDAVADLDRLSIPALAVHATGDPWVAAWGVERAYRQVGLAPRRLVPVAAEVHDLGDDHGAALTALELLTQAVCSADPGHLEAVNVPGVGELLETIVAEAAWQASQAQELVAG